MKIFLCEAWNYYWIENLEPDAVTTNNYDLPDFIILVVCLSTFSIIFNSTIQSLRVHCNQRPPYLRSCFVENDEIKFTLCMSFSIFLILLPRVQCVMKNVLLVSLCSYYFICQNHLFLFLINKVEYLCSWLFKPELTFSFSFALFKTSYLYRTFWLWFKFQWWCIFNSLLSRVAFTKL